ncbi:MAG: hypothetical protein HQL29_03955 [Candidatus Omnitrophica bacterium]|nr:hypothetical protein [Candidatus Omnitrophota bacterium]
MKTAGKTVNKYELEVFLANEALVKELKELAPILKCKVNPDRRQFGSELTYKLYRYYQTPVGNVVLN